MNYSDTNVKNNLSFFAKVEILRILTSHFLPDLLPKVGQSPEKVSHTETHFLRFWEKKVENPARGASLQKSKSKSKNVRIPSILILTFAKKGKSPDLFLEKPGKILQKSKSKSKNRRTQTLLALTYALKDFCQLTRSLVFAQKCTLITSLSELISVFKQPTSSVVFRVLYVYHDDSYSQTFRLIRSIHLIWIYSQSNYFFIIRIMMSIWWITRVDD